MPQEKFRETQVDRDDLTDGMDGVAIIGMSARLPGAPDLETYWQNLREGSESIRSLTDPDLSAAGVEPERLEDPNYVKARGVLDDVELFDAAFFGLTPREAETMDPQHRLFLEESWKALEHAGCDPDTYGGVISVFAGANLTGYLLHNLAGNHDLVQRVGPLQIRIRNDKDFLATLAAYKLNLTGSAVNVQTACSSSLVSVALACQSLLSFQCDMVLAGGISVTVPNLSGYFQQEGVYAPDGHCRAFDVGARGTVLGDGVAVVVLKRLEDALEDGDTIQAVIRGFATNNDGSLKLDYTAPSVDGQAEVIAMAHALGEIDAETISYVEAHGTGTPLGDLVEVAALTQAFRSSTDRVGFCGLGSVKTNIGHLDAAAGTASLIKTVLALQRRQLPPTLHFESPNPQLGLETSPFRVISELEEWRLPKGQRRRAGVSSFGVGGTNAHVVLEEAPEEVPSGPSRPWQLLLLSARSNASLATMMRRLADHLEREDAPLGDVSYTLACGRRNFELRRAMVCRDRREAVSVLRGEQPRQLIAANVRPENERKVAFMFSGIGDQYVGMGRELYESEPVFRQAIDASASLLEPRLGFDPRTVLYPAGLAPSRQDGVDEGPDLRAMLGRGAVTPTAEAERLNRTEVLHPVLFMLEYALAQQWMAWGIRPESMIGYSIGEYVAACLAGVFSLEDALKLVAERARIIERRPGGAMLAVSRPEDEVRALLDEPPFSELSLAAVNGPAFCVVAGAPDTIETLAVRLAERDVVHRRLKASHAFHSRQLETALDAFRVAMTDVELSPPKIPFVANVTGTWITDEEATDPNYWAEHMCRTVRFGDGVSELLEESRILLEIGPGQNLTSIVLQSADQTPTALASLPHEYDSQDAQGFLLHSLGRLWSVGVTPVWPAFFEEERRHRIPLPTYAFDRQRYWVDPVEQQTPRPDRSLDKRLDLGDWFSVPVWQQKSPLATVPTAAEGSWLVLAADAEPKGLADPLVTAFQQLGGEVILAVDGQPFSEVDEDRFTLDGSSRADYEALFRDLAAKQRLPRHLIYLRSLSAESPERVCFFDLLQLVQAWETVTGAEGTPLSLTAVSSDAFEVIGDENPTPEQALLAGPCRVIPQEYPKIDCRQIDLPRLAPEDDPASLAATLAREILIGKASLTAIRGRRRWVRSTESVRLPAATAETTRLRPRGVYLITGGLGGLGLTLAEHLAQSYQARLALVGRSPFPSRDEWSDLLATLAPEDSLHQILRRLETFESAGAEVLVLQGDVTDRQQMEAVRATVDERFGRIHGVIHAAGQAPGGLIQLRDRQTAAAVLAPKVAGTRVVDQVFGDAELDFLLLCSSLTALTGALGLVDHSAANAFLDAYAQGNARRRGTRTLSVNWDSWLEVGQAAEAGVASRIEALLSPEEDSPLLPSFPRWNHRVEEPGASFLCRLTADHWILKEHRFQGLCLLPGTAYLELACRAASAELGGEGVLLRNVEFAHPLQLDDAQERLLRLRLTSEDGAFSFRVESAENTAGPWVEHSTGRLETLPVKSDPSTQNFSSLARRWPTQEITEDTLPLVEFGPRWTGLLKELRHGEREGWARLELSTAFADDLQDFALHPALADVATGIVRVLGPGAYLPLSYDQVRLYGPMPAAVQCHFQISEDSRSAETLVSDIWVADLEGRLVLEARGYTLRHLNEAPGTPAVTTLQEPTPSRPFAAVASGRTSSDTKSFGLLPREGAEAFDRLMTQALDEPQILVSVRDFAAAAAEMESLTGERAAKHLALLSSGPALRTGRNGSQAPYEAPRNDLERTIVRLYEDMLGEKRVGIHDNFFDLGGNSLVATQLITRLRQEFGVDITLRTLFETPTAAELGRRVVQEQAANVDQEELAAALSELAELSPDELLQELEQADA